jgi:chaperonin cofactor prefoldin
VNKEITEAFAFVEERFDRVSNRHKSMGHKMAQMMERIEKLEEELKKSLQPIVPTEDVT